MAIEPDTKDWTWVLRERCPECGVDSAAEDPRTVAVLLRDAVGRWQAVLSRADVGVRPDDATWSPLEYAAHVRDVCRIFDGRLRLMLEQDEPTFLDWDQDAAADEGGYAALDPAVLGEEVATDAHRLADAFAAVPEDRWGRRGVRSNGSEFTVLTLSQYFAHDVLHHLHDVRG